MASTIASTIAGSRPSLKFGTAMSRGAGLMRVEDTGCNSGSQAFTDPYAPAPDAANWRVTEAIRDLVMVPYVPEHEVRRSTRRDRADAVGQAQCARAAGRGRHDRFERVHAHLRACERQHERHRRGR